VYRNNGKLSWRKLWNLVSQLPPESATATILRVERQNSDIPMPTAEPDHEVEQWSRVEHLLAAVRDELHFLRHSYVQAHAGKTKLKWKPEPLPRPGVKNKKKREVLADPQIETLWAHLQRTQN
jgi:hypothetical protein